MNYADNVMESSASTSASTVVLAGAAANCRAFATPFALATTNIPVKIGPDTAGAWLVGVYTLTDAATLTRTAILSSSAAGNADVTLAAGSKDVQCVHPAAYIVDPDNAATLANKRLKPRVVAVTQSATPTINTDNGDVFRILALASAVTSMTSGLSGTPAHGEQIIIEITDNGSAKTILWGSAYESSTVTLPATTVGAALLAVTLAWNAASSKWRCVGVA